MAGLVLLHDVVRVEEKMLVEAASRMNVDLKLLDSRELLLDSGSAPSELLGSPVLQRSVSYYRNLHTTAYIEMKGGTVVNSFRTTLISGNKLLTTLALEAAGVPTPRTYVAFSKEKAMEGFQALGGKAVLKPVLGSWGRMVALLDSQAGALSVLEDREEMDPLYQVYYLQEYVDRPPRDIRIFVVGSRAIAAIYRYQPPGDWRTNTARGGRAEPCEITKEMEDVAVRAAEAVGGGALGIDMMESEERGLLVHEVNHNTEFRNSVRATGVDIAGAIIEYAVQAGRR